MSISKNSTFLLAFSFLLFFLGLSIGAYFLFDDRIGWKRRDAHGRPREQKHLIYMEGESMEDTLHRFIIIISISSMSISVHDGIAFWFFHVVFFSFLLFFPFLSFFVPDSPLVLVIFFSLQWRTHRK